MKFITTLAVLLICFLGAQAFCESSDTVYWKEKTLSEPSPLNYFNLGVALQKDSNYDSALEAYDQVISLNGKLAQAAIYYKALIYTEQNKPDLARNSLELLKGQPLPPFLNQQVTELSEKLNPSIESDAPSAAAPAMTLEMPVQNQKENFISAFFDLSYGSNSNPKTIPDVSSSQVSADEQSQAQARLSALLNASGFYDLKLNYDFSGVYFKKDVAYNYNYHDISLPISVYFGSYRLRLTPQYFFDYYGDAKFSEAAGGTLDLTRHFGKISAKAAVSYQSINNLTNTYYYLSGSQQKAQLSVLANLDQVRLQASVYGTRLSYLDTADSTYSYDSVASSLDFMYFVKGFDVSLSASIEDRFYEKAVNYQTARNDLKTLGSVQAGYSFFQKWRVYVATQYIYNKSNFQASNDNHTYRQSLYTAGTSFAF